MAENQEKRSVTPGLVKAEIYSKPKVYSVNPTLQVVETELPVTKKSVIFTEHLAETITFASWMPPEGELKLTPEMVSQDIVVQPVEIPKKITKKSEKSANVKFEKRVEVKTPSEMEILNQAAMLSEVKAEIKQPKVEEIKMEIPKVVEPPKVNKPSEMEIINKVMPTEPKHEQPTIQQDKSEVLMFVDKTEVKLTKDSDNKDVYLLNNKTVAREEVVKFMQSISGKVLAMDCKSIKIRGVQYKLQGMSYQGSDGRTLSIDDMLELVHI